MPREQPKGYLDPLLLSVLAKGATALQELRGQWRRLSTGVQAVVEGSA
jgi:hypothetical protein